MPSPMEQFEQRKKDNAGKQIDNSRLHAGSPMYFYCRHCGVQTEVCPEGYMWRPKRVCDDCEKLVAQGLID